MQFEIDASRVWFTTYLIGQVSDAEISAGYLDFLQGGEWAPSMYELVDLSDADMSRVTAAGLTALASTFADILEKDGVSGYRTAVFSPNDLPFGLARLYAAYTLESPESVRVFRDRANALRWLLDQTS